ncbi:hypothetical protein GUITHDRAFT_154142 [Guillardia theta CCMP2712]|uniref:Uncharacterized protein n=1 Tax=Guillardia theta (strain CCMP2712) TaxID=905079 RepID=L1IX78_GUITC|nr:hypothetical protein GUITHDRAFT_154142 [Guillardia theta CCMP2712]EKX40489.1 hypothetical protein GUITHDRAFT_154142 [Guillardia theta CCMP2712]|eukprot:XP_005827469.1 hypothetical protein GUITHDRAFT_154142 [Guillardia theta CCMP2712]
MLACHALCASVGDSATLFPCRPSKLYAPCVVDGDPPLQPPTGRFNRSDPAAVASRFYLPLPSSIRFREGVSGDVTEETLMENVKESDESEGG